MKLIHSKYFELIFLLTEPNNSIRAYALCSLVDTAHHPYRRHMRTAHESILAWPLFAPTSQQIAMTIHRSAFRMHSLYFSKFNGPEQDS